MIFSVTDNNSACNSQNSGKLIISKLSHNHAATGKHYQRYHGCWQSQTQDNLKSWRES